MREIEVDNLVLKKHNSILDYSGLYIICYVIKKQ